MEAAATFAVAAHRGVEAGAAFVARDYLGPEEWEPRFREAEQHLHRLGDIARAALATHLERAASSPPDSGDTGTVDSSPESPESHA